MVQDKDDEAHDGHDNENKKEEQKDEEFDHHAVINEKVAVLAAADNPPFAAVSPLPPDLQRHSQQVSRPGAVAIPGIDRQVSTNSIDYRMGPSSTSSITRSADEESNILRSANIPPQNQSISNPMEQQQDHPMRADAEEVSSELMMAEVVDEGEMRRQMQQEISRQIHHEIMQSAVYVDAVEIDQTASSTIASNAYESSMAPTPSSEPGRRRRKQCLVFGTIVVLLGIVVAVVVPLVIFVPRINQHNDATSQRLNDFRMQLLPLSGATALYNTSSPQYAALLWLAEEDPQVLPESTPIQNITERFILAVLYYATNGPHWLQNTNFLTRNSVCSWNNGTSGIFCYNQTLQLSLGESSRDDNKRVCKRIVLSHKTIFSHAVSKAAEVLKGAFRTSCGT
jgi:hypothetical protein